MTLDWDHVSELLSQPLAPGAIKPPPQGKYGEYVDGYHVIREANRIFGYNGWSYAITSMEPCWRHETENGQVRVAYRCTVRVTVDGVTREGAAVGTGIAKPASEGDAHESAVKEAETDAMKRGLRSFGNTFGLALYEKDKSKREVGKPQQERDPRAIADGLIATIAKAQNYSQYQQTIGGGKFDAAWKWLEEAKPPMANEVKAAVEKKRAEVDPAMQAPPQENAEGGHEYA